MLIFALVLFGCTDGGNDAGDAATDGTLTVTYTGNGTYNGDDLVAAVFSTGADTMVDDPLGVYIAEISGNTVSVTLQEYEGGGPNGTDWVGTANTTYDLYILIDRDGNMEPSSGDQIYNSLNPVQYTQDGNKIIDALMDAYDGYQDLFYLVHIGLVHTRKLPYITAAFFNTCFMIRIEI